MTIGQKIAAARKVLGLTQKEVADALDVSIQAVSQWETDRARVRQNRIRALAKLLKLKISDITPMGEGEIEGRPRSADDIAADGPKLISDQAQNDNKVPAFLLPGPYFVFSDKDESKPIARFKKIVFTDTIKVDTQIALILYEDDPSAGLLEGDLMIFDYGVAPKEGDIIIVTTVKRGHIVMPLSFRDDDFECRLARYTRNNDGVTKVTSIDGEEELLDGVTLLLATMVERRTYRRT